MKKIIIALVFVLGSLSLQAQELYWETNVNKAIEVSKAEGSSSLFLQVNKHNNAYTFYVKNGFIKEQEFK